MVLGLRATVGGCWGLSTNAMKAKNKDAHKANKGIVREK